MANIENRVETLIKEKIESLGYELYDVEYSKEAKNYFLRIYIDSQGGIDLNDCEKVSVCVGDLLDEAGIILEQYFLEVSSPGIERILRKEEHLNANIGNKIEIRLFKKDQFGEKIYQGILKRFNENELEISNDADILVDRKNIAQIKTIYDWEN